MNTVYLVSCGKRKSDFACKARDLYNSERFSLSLKIADESRCSWYIVSAKHGLLHPEQMVAPYDLALSTLSADEKSQWASSVAKSFSQAHPNSRAVVFADKEYSTSLSTAFIQRKLSIICPFQDATLDEQVAYLRNTSNQENLSHFYSILSYLAEKTGGVRLLKECTGKMKWPKKGVYFILDFSEQSSFSNHLPRVIRVGTHAISRNSKSTLWGRIKTHKGLNNGGGSHRSSVFRLHVGNALIQRERIDCPSWSKGQSASKDIRDTEIFLEKMVTSYIGNLGVITIDVDDEASSQSNRALIEKNSISLLSSLNYSLEFPSNEWLGRSSVKDEIRKSALWNINHVSDVFDRGFFDVFESYANHTVNNV